MSGGETPTLLLTLPIPLCHRRRRSAAATVANNCCNDAAALQRIVWQMTGNLKGCLCSRPPAVAARCLPHSNNKETTRGTTATTRLATGPGITKCCALFALRCLCLAGGYNFNAQLDKQLNPRTAAAAAATAGSSSNSGGSTNLRRTRMLHLTRLPYRALSSLWPIANPFCYLYVFCVLRHCFKFHAFKLISRLRMRCSAAERGTKTHKYTRMCVCLCAGVGVGNSLAFDRHSL